MTSCTSVGGTKYDLDLLKSDVSHAKSRVQRLKRELANIDSEMMYKQRGVDTLARFAIFQKYFDRRAGAPRAIRYRMAIQTPPHTNHKVNCLGIFSTKFFANCSMHFCR